MAFGYQQSISNTYGAEPQSLQYTSSVAAGSLLIGAAYWESNTVTITSVSDPVNGAWTLAGSPQVGADTLAGWSFQLFYKIGAGAGTTNVTIDLSGAVSSLGLALHEFTTAGATLDASPVYNQATGTAPTSSAIVTTATDDLLFAGAVVQTGVDSGNPGAGYTIGEVANFGGNGTEYDLTGGSPGSKTASFNLTSGDAGTDSVIGFIAFKEGGGALQTLLPASDSVDGAWTDQAGGTSLAAAIDEATASDTDYIRSQLGPSSSSCRVKLAPGGDPQSSTDHNIKWRIAKDTAGGGTIGMTVKLYQGGGNSIGGGTLIASFTRSNVSETFTDFTEALSAGEADSITNYADLYLEFFANQT